MLNPGDVISKRYIVESRLGQGGMGSVWKGHDKLLDVDVAIKEVDPSVAQQPGGTDAFLQEAKVALKLRHPNIVGFCGFEQVGSGKNKQLYLITNLVPGRTLQAVLNDMRLSNQFYSPQSMFRIMKQILAGLDYAHQNGVIHRDVKPHNVMLDNDLATLIDFGIAKSAQAGVGTQFLSSGAYTPFYSPPEQLMKSGTSAATDVYAAGVMAYEMLTGQAQQVYPQQSTVRLHNDPVTRLPYVSHDMEQVLMRATAPIDKVRFQSAAMFSLELERVIFGHSQTSSPQPPVPPSSPQPIVTSPTQKTKFDIRR